MRHLKFYLGGSTIPVEWIQRAAAGRTLINLGRRSDLEGGLNDDVTSSLDGDRQHEPGDSSDGVVDRELWDWHSKPTQARLQPWL